MVLDIVVIVLLVSMACAVVRAIRGPSVFERILAANVFGTKTLLLICVIGFLKGSPEDYLDIALMNAIVAFLGTVAILRCVEHGGFSSRKGDDDDA